MLDPNDLEEPHAERLIGDELVAQRRSRGSTTRPTCAARRAARPRPSARARRRGGFRVSRRFALLVNPASAGGKALRALPAVHAELDRLGAPRTVTTRSIEHAGEEASRAAQRGEAVLALGGDGLLRPWPAPSRARTPRSLSFRAGAATTSRACSRSRGPRGSRSRGGRGIGATARRGRPRRHSVRGHRELRFDSDANRIANNARVIKGDAVYFYAALRALAQWRPAHFTVGVDGEQHEVVGYSVVVGNSKAYGGGMYVLPQADLDDGKLDVMLCTDVSKRTFLRDLPKVFKGTHLDLPYVRSLRGSVIELPRTGRS